MSKSESKTTANTKDLVKVKELTSSTVETQFNTDHKITTLVNNELDNVKEPDTQLYTDHKAKTSNYDIAKSSNNESIIADITKTIFEKKNRNKRRKYTLIETFESKEEALKRLRDPIDEKSYIYRYLIITLFLEIFVFSKIIFSIIWAFFSF
jgi:hypothetical protein